jgi:diaminopimelate decarboxylase
VLEFAARMRVHDFVLREFSPGGGFAIGYVPDGQPPSVREYATEICAAVIAGCDALGLDEPALIVEPGRAIVGRAGVAVYSVGAIKEVPGVRNFVSVDGGMGDNIRPALYGAKYSVVSVNSPLSPHNYEATIAGKYCESGDLLVQGAGIPVPRPGDLLAMPASGAYCIPMASNYNMATKPAVLMVAKGKARLIRRRETYDDLLATSVL